MEASKTKRWQIPGTVSASALSCTWLEVTGEYFVKLIGNFHAEGIELMVEVGCVVKVELMTARCVPDYKLLAVHEVEMSDGETIILVDPDSHEWLARGAFSANSGRQELDLFIGHALDRDLTGSPTSNRWNDN
jgi:hypothetical protein